jgi:hypothetical protein
VREVDGFVLCCLWAFLASQLAVPDLSNRIKRCASNLSNISFCIFIFILIFILYLYFFSLRTQDIPLSELIESGEVLTITDPTLLNVSLSIQLDLV